MVRLHRLRLLTALLVAGGCTRSLNPCPEGTFRQDDVCMTLEDAASPTASPDADQASPLPQAEAGPNSSLPGECGGEASNEARPADANVPEAGDPQTCAPLDIVLWRGFHMADDMIGAINRCIAAEPACLEGSCQLDRCLRRDLKVAGCSDCIASEVACIASYCRTECRRNSSSSQCRTCACESGCVEAFEECAVAELRVCPTPVEREPSPGAGALAPELIMVVVGG